MGFLVTMLLHFLLAGSHPRVAATYHNVRTGQLVLVRAAIFCNGNAGLLLADVNPSLPLLEESAHGTSLLIDGHLWALEGPATSATFKHACATRH